MFFFFLKSLHGLSFTSQPIFTNFVVFAVIRFLLLKILVYKIDGWSIRKRFNISHFHAKFLISGLVK